MCLDGIRKITKTSVRIVSVQATIQTLYVPNTNQKRNRKNQRYCSDAVYIGRSYQDCGGTYCLHLQEEAYTSVQGRQNTIRIRSEKMVN